MARRLLAIIEYHWMHALAPSDYENVPLVSRTENLNRRVECTSTIISWRLIVGVH